jgi:cyclic pyranopterin monophosphate synthase
MVDVGAKVATAREAIADGRIYMSEEALRQVIDGHLPKGDVECVARLAGIQGAKRTADLIPLCHPLSLDHVAVTVEPELDKSAVRVTASVRCTGRTGVEMEALTAVAVALLAVYDMVKAVDPAMRIGEVSLREKKGGKQVYRRAEPGEA